MKTPIRILAPAAALVLIAGAGTAATAGEFESHEYRSSESEVEFESHDLEVGNIAVTPNGAPGAGSVHVFAEVRLKPEDYMCLSATPNQCRFTSVVAAVATSQVCNSAVDGSGTSVVRTSVRNGPNLRTLVNQGMWTPFTNRKGKLVYYSTTFEVDLTEYNTPTCPTARPNPIGPLYFSRLDLYVAYASDYGSPTRRVTAVDRNGVWVAP